MNNMKRVLALMADGKPRDRFEIEKALGLSRVEARGAIRRIKKAGSVSIVQIEPAYTITDSGKAALEAARRPRGPAIRSVEAANAKISEKMRLEREASKAQRETVRKEREAEKREEARLKIERASMVWRAKSGQVPNSVFAMGSLA